MFLMNGALTILILEAMAVYLLVLWTHSLRRRFGLVHFFALLGGLTAIMSWITDAGVSVQVAGVTFMVGSTVFYTSLLLGVFVVYVFDGPAAARIAISTVAGVSILAPVVTAVLHAQMALTEHSALRFVPIPSLRINAASVIATALDMLFLGMAWEFLSRPRMRIGLGLRAFLTLLGVMWLDVLLFATGAFLGTPDYARIVTGTFASRLAISFFAWPFLYGYFLRESRRTKVSIESRPVLAIVKEAARVRGELDVARDEIARRERADRDRTALIEAIPVPIFVKTRDGRYTECNRAFELLTGLRRDGILGKTVYDIAPKEIADEYERKDRELFDSPGCQSYEWRVMRPDGDVRDVVFSKATLSDTSGAVTGLVGVILDITERKRAEEQRQAFSQRMRQQEKLAAIGTLAGGAAHEINNPLQGIMSFAQLIQDRVPPADAMHEYAAEIVQGSERIAAIVSAMLGFAEKQSTTWAPTRVADVVRGVLPFAEPGLIRDGIALKVAVPEDLPMVSCHTPQIQRVLMDLITNAREALNEKYPHADPGKSLALSAMEIHGGGVWIMDSGSGAPDATARGRAVRITVEDVGTGIDPTIAEHVFDPFFTTRSRTGHSGLGLPTSLGIVRDHGGRLTFESKAGSGSKFHVDLPVHETLRGD